MDVVAVECLERESLGAVLVREGLAEDRQGYRGGRCQAIRKIAPASAAEGSSTTAMRDSRRGDRRCGFDP